MNTGSPLARRRAVNALLLASGGWIAGLLPQVSSAQDFPSRPVTIVVPYGPGSFTDTVLRPVAAALQRELGQPVIVDNKAGANGVIGSQFAAHAKPDGYTLLAGSSTTLAANAGLFKTLPYDPVKDFQPVAGLAVTSMMIMVRADHPAKDLASLLAMARKEKAPLPMAYGSSSAQVAVALLTRASGVPFTAVPYKGTPQALTDLVGGTVPAAIVDVSNGVPQIKAGKLRALAISGTKRSGAAPDVPTLAETWPGTQLVTWIALVAPTGTPAPVVERLHTAVSNVLGSAELKSQLANLATDVEAATPAQLGKRVVEDQAQWLELIKTAGIQAE